MCNLSRGILDKGIEQGFGLGIEQGQLDKAMEVAKNGLLNNVPLDIIMIMSGLSKEEIEGIKSKIQ